jgi:hypothetical protein
VVCAGGDVLNDTVPLRVGHRHPRGEQIVDDCAGKSGFPLEVAKIAAGDFPLDFAVERRCSGRDVDRARRRVLSEKGTLRAAQDFDALDIDEVESPCCRARMIDLVDIEADARLQAVIGL